MSDTIGMITIDLAEYNRLKQENIELHSKISLLTNELTNELTKLNTNILEKNLENEMLRKENHELREKIRMREKIKFKRE